jgi:hypothetical protein
MSSTCTIIAQKDHPVRQVDFRRGGFPAPIRRLMLARCSTSARPNVFARQSHTKIADMDWKYTDKRFDND